LDYPLVDPSPDIQYLLADAYLAIESNDLTATAPFRIKWLYGVGCAALSAPSWAPTPTHAADVLIVDANDVAVFNSTLSGVSFSTWCWGLKKTSGSCNSTYDYKIYEWQSGAAVCRFVVYQTWPTSADGLDENSTRDFATNIAPAAAVLDERAVYRIPKRVKSFVLPGATSSANVKITNATLDVSAGLNTLLTTSDVQARGLRSTRQVTIAAIAGTGLGKYVDCAETQPVIRSLNGISGPNVLLSAGDCLWAHVPTTYNAATGKLTPQRTNNRATQQVGSNCPACCTCSDYVDIATYMNNTRDRYKFIGSEAGDVLVLHSDNITRWEAQRNCRLQKPIKACMTAQVCPYIDVAAQYCNNCTDCAHDVVLTINMAAYPDNTAEPVCNYSMITTPTLKQGLFNLDGSWPTFTARLGDVDAGNSASVSFRLLFAEAQATTVKVTVTGASAEGPIKAGCEANAPLAAGIASKALYCDDSGNTITLC
jgi:hypothetical protein